MTCQRTCDMSWRQQGLADSSHRQVRGLRVPDLDDDLIDWK